MVWKSIRDANSVVSSSRSLSRPCNPSPNPSPSPPEVRCFSCVHLLLEVLEHVDEGIGKTAHRGQHHALHHVCTIFALAEFLALHLQAKLVRLLRARSAPLPFAAMVVA